MIERIKAPYGDSWIFFAFLGGLFVFVFIRLVYAILFHRDRTFFFKISIISADKSDNKSYLPYRILVVFAYSYTMALLFSLVANTLSEGFIDSPSRFMLLLAGVLVFMNLKFILNSILFWMFDIGELFKGMLLKNISFRLSLGFYSMIFLFMAYYSDFWHLFSNINTLIILFLAYILIFIAAMAEFFAYKVRYFLYFIFYLCIVELCPLLIAWSIFGQATT